MTEKQIKIQRVTEKLVEIARKTKDISILPDILELQRLFYEALNDNATN